ncbi:MAG: glycosyl hydrolase [Lutibacter sp.]|uniref:VPS10 domain-containing protein n=1 Tax=Lutibacter sp. TaxID=1925666 RepID=UPI0017E24D1F|nr:glycosyl hydrolase [Lutibacter sp.]MBT8317240.1 glycosyl hydrolase [Lutibacter sp.]NNJ58100.1 glycosyl hydrolase [Lutibacter sp.]
MKKSFLFFSLLFLSLIINAQSSIVQNVPFTNIGPSIMSGRIVAIDVNPNNPIEFYAAYASGGLWYTNNNGTSFSPIADNAPTQNMGAIAVDWEHGTIWIGTGESNSSRSSYAGIGMLKSTDKGNSWQHVGLEDSQHIGKIIINKNNPDEVVVGVIGHLYTPNAERGIYKTTDGGKTWKNVLFINENTGVIDISVSPTNPNILYAASWERERKAWNFDGDGENSGIYKSEDAGTSWTKITSEDRGFPTGSGIGRIGLATYNDTIIYALLDNQFTRPEEKKKKVIGYIKDNFRDMSQDAFLKLDDKKLNAFLKDNNFPKKYTAENVKQSVKKGKIKPIDLVTYLEDANYVLLNSEVIGAELYKSEDGGKTWKKTHKDYLDGVYSSYGYYFGTIGVNTSNQNKIYIGGVPLLKSDDGGKTFKAIGKENVHSDHQAIWVNSKLEGHLINGNDGGLNITYDDGENWIKNNAQSVGQFYSVNVDNQKPYNVYGGLQDNGVWFGPSNYKASKNWEDSGQYPYKMIGGGDGMQVQIDSRDHNVMYSGSQFGYYYRVNLKTEDYLDIHPTHELGDSPYRYNWQTPILLSPHNQDILYMGANKLLRSMDKGETFVVISGDLTTGGKKGNVAYGTLTTISESAFQFGLIYVGSDDGYIHITKNGGGTWERISDNLPKDLWVSRVIASQHQKERVYATLNGYRNDDFKPYIFVSEDFGKTWKNIMSNLPNSSINVIKEDNEDENMLYVGTDNGVYVSFDRGDNWHLFSNGLPKVAVHDLVIQNEAKDLVIGTHGRSIYKASVAPLQHYNTIKNEAITLFEIPSIQYSSRWGSAWNKWIKPYEPSATIPYYVMNSGKYVVEVLTEDSTNLMSFNINAVKGYNYFDYDLSVTEDRVTNYFFKNDISVKQAKNEKYYLPKGNYIIKISGDRQSAEQEFIIK